MAVGGVGFLTRVVSNIRTFVNEPDVTSALSDTFILDRLRAAWSDVMSDLNRSSTFKPRARMDLTVIANQAEYVLPPTIAAFQSLEKLDESGNLEWEIVPSHPLNPIGPGFTIELPILRFDPIWTEGETLRLTWQPNAEAPMFEGTATSGSTATTIAATSVAAGKRDLRPHAYVGYTLRRLNGSGEPVEERIVTAYSGTNFTVAPAFSSTMADAVFEVLACHVYRMEDILGLKTARKIASISADPQRARGLQDEYLDALRSLRLDLSQGEQRIGRKLERSIRGRRRWGKTR